MKSPFVKGLLKVNKQDLFFWIACFRSTSSLTVLGIETSCDDTAVVFFFI